jgi:threonine dehydrogenase-like Zn-dependent dehydrogenase
MEMAPMKALTIEPGTPDSLQLDEVPDPPVEQGAILAKTRLIGVCGTDLELASGRYGWAPPGRRRLVIGHESLATVVEAPEGSGFERGDLLVGIVRRPDPVPCPNCAVGEWDMCRNDRYTERGIKELDGYCAEYFRIEPAFAIKLDPHLQSCGVLLEPCSVVAKAWDHIDRIGRRTHWMPRRVLVTGAGPVGLLAAFLGVQRDLEVHVLDRVATGIKPALVRELGAQYHHEGLDKLGFRPDIVIECTGVASVIVEVTNITASGSIVCLAGVSSKGYSVPLDVGLLNRTLVLENDVIFGSVNANHLHYEAAAAALAKGDTSWLNRLLTRRVPLARWQEAFERRDGDVKTVIEFAEQA